MKFMNSLSFRLALATIALGSLPLFAASAPLPAVAAGFKVVAWNDLGMHCMDSDYSVFSILPPFNNVYAQLMDSSGNLITNPAGYTLTYEAVADPTGSINTTSVGKTNFWLWSQQLYGASPVPNTGLAGHNMPGPGNTPQPMTWDATASAWTAVGVPLSPYDDLGHKRTYPLMKIVARNNSGVAIASTTPVLPVSDELDCRACHASGSGPAAMPSTGWVYDNKSERDFRLNILRLHDEYQLGTPLYTSSLAQAGFSSAGLEASVVALAKPVLCASCHGSNALPGTGIAPISKLTAAMHAGHAFVLDPTNGMTLEANENREACYRCHPGSSTRCLRGVMGSAVAPNGELSMQCQSCHGSMNTVGAPARDGWLDEPSCQNCHTGTATHNNGQIVFTDAFDTNGLPRVAVDQTFATNPNTPLPGKSLYKLSEGHGGLLCESCHGSTHAEYPAAHPNDNLGVIALQGHDGVITDCTACHATQPSTVTGGPHGMHPTGSGWVSGHGDIVENGGAAQCAKCHGADYRGTLLSATKGNRTFNAFGTKNFWQGFRVSCYSCHNGPGSENASPNTPAIVSNAAITVADVPVALTLSATDQNGNALTRRIVRQPSHGRVGLSGSLATYIPDPGFAGTDTFTYAAFDTFTDSNLGTVTVTRKANWGNYGFGYPGTNGAVPAFIALGNPSLGTSVSLLLGNSSGNNASVFLLMSTEQANLPTNKGGALLTELLLSLALPMPPSGLNLLWAVPNDPVLSGLSVYLQSVQSDPAAHFGFAFSDGLRLTLGP